MQARGVRPNNEQAYFQLIDKHAATLLKNSSIPAGIQSKIVAFLASDPESRVEDTSQFLPTVNLEQRFVTSATESQFSAFDDVAPWAAALGYSAATRACDSAHIVELNSVVAKPENLTRHQHLLQLLQLIWH